MCQLICGTSRATARSYWKNIKRRHDCFSIHQGYDNPQLTLPCADGKWYACDVLDMEGVLYLIAITQHPCAQIFKTYLYLLGKAKLSQALATAWRTQGKQLLQHIKTTGRAILFSTSSIVYFAINNGYAPPDTLYPWPQPLPQKACAA